MDVTYWVSAFAQKGDDTLHFIFLGTDEGSEQDNNACELALGSFSPNLTGTP